MNSRQADRGTSRGRPPRRGSNPTISVVLVGGGEATQFRFAASSLARQCARAGAELVIVTSDGGGDAVALARSTGARLVSSPRAASDSDMRVLGLAECSGDIVAFVSDSREFPEDWIDALCHGRLPPRPIEVRAEGTNAEVVPQ